MVDNEGNGIVLSLSFSSYATLDTAVAWIYAIFEDSPPSCPADITFHSHNAKEYVVFLLSWPKREHPQEYESTFILCVCLLLLLLQSIALKPEKQVTV